MREKQIAIYCLRLGPSLWFSCLERTAFWLLNLLDFLDIGGNQCDSQVSGVNTHAQ